MTLKLVKVISVAKHGICSYLKCFLLSILTYLFEYWRGSELQNCLVVCECIVSGWRGGKRHSVHLFRLYAGTLSVSQEGPSPVLILSIVSVCGVDVVSIKFAMELFRETLERKVSKGKNNNEGKQKTEVQGITQQ